MDVVIGGENAKCMKSDGANRLLLDTLVNEKGHVARKVVTGPFPKFRKANNACDNAHGFEMQARTEIRIALPPHSKLAGRFPTLSSGRSPIKG